MPIPSTWSQVKQTERITSQGWEITQSWEGMAGEGGVDLSEWLASFYGYSGVSITREFPTETGNGKATADITFSATAAGAVRPPGDSDFGLIKRTWTRHANSVQDSILNHPNVNELVLIDAAWPTRINAVAELYRVHLKTFQEEVVSLPANTPPAMTEPDPAAYCLAASPNRNTANDTATWLFAELARDAGASYDFDQYVLRKSEVVTSSTVLRASDTNVGRLLTYSTLTTSEPTLPAAALLSSAGLTTWYWLKKSPEIEAVSGGNFQIVQEYWGLPLVTALTNKRYGEPL